MINPFRTYGKKPYTLAVIHGGPGAPGEMAPLAKELGKTYGVFEPFQTMDSLQGQLDELYTLLKENAQLPVILIGYSWGAMLSLLFTARHPTLVRKLILISSGVYHDEYAIKISDTRLNRMNEKEKEKELLLIERFNDPNQIGKNQIFLELGKMASKVDAYDPIPHKSQILKDFQNNAVIYEKVWGEAQHLRKMGGFLEEAKKIQCPVVAIHGDYDPHPIDGIKLPLMQVLKDFKFITLEKCGHVPWFEKQAKDKFYEILFQELS